MIKLPNTATTLEVKLGSAATTNELEWYTTWVDIDQSDALLVAADYDQGVTTGVASATIVPPPDADTTRKVDFISISNTDTTNKDVIVQVSDGLITSRLIKITLAPDQTVQYADGEGWSLAGKKFTEIGLNDEVATGSLMELVRTVLTSDNSQFNAKVTDLGCLQVTPPPEGKSAFGNALVSQESPVVQLTYAYELNPYLLDVRNNGGSASISQSMVTLSSGAGANQSSSMQSLRHAHYQGGTAVRCKFTALYTAGVTGSQQLVGAGDTSEGFFFGYLDDEFGILRRYGGNPEIRQLQITTASSTAENITITLDDDVDATVAVTASGVITTTVNEIAAHDFSNVGRGWKAAAVGDKVVFTSWGPGSKSGAYSVSGTTVVGTFSQLVAGADYIDDWYPQSTWVGDDRFDGFGPSGETLNPTKGNVYQIDFQYLGFGIIRFFAEHPTDGNFHLVHFIHIANVETRPSLDNPTLPVFAIVENTTNTTDLIVQSASMAIFEDGNRRTNGINRGSENTKILATVNETPVLAIRIGEVRSGKVNKSEVKVNLVGCAVEHNKPVQIKFYANPILTGASFSQLDAYSSIYEDKSATAFSGGLFLFSLPLGRTGNSLIDIKQELDLGRFGAGDVLLATAKPNSGTGAEAVVSFNLTELL